MAGGSSLQKLRDNPAGEEAISDGWFKLAYGHEGPPRATRSSGADGAPMFKATGPLVTFSTAMRGAAEWLGGGPAAAGCFFRSESSIRVPLTILAQFVCTSTTGI